MKRYNLFAFFIIYFFGSVAFGQEYLITLKGDTIKGKLKIEKIGKEKKIYLTDINKKKSVFSMFQFREATIKGEKYVPFKRGDVFDIVKVLQSGYLSLYSFQMESQQTYDGLYLAKRDGEAIEVPNLQFKKQVSKLVDDCPEVKIKVESKEFKRSDLSKIISEYNTCIESKTEASYLKQVPEKRNLHNDEKWIALKNKIEESQLTEKTNLLEMLEEIKTKKSKGEKIPNFLINSFSSGISNNNELLKLFEALIQE